MKKSEYLEKREELRREYEQKLAALDMVWAMFAPKKTAQTNMFSPSGQQTTNGSWAHDISKRDAIRDAAKKFGDGTFSAHEVRDSLSTLYPQMSQEITDNDISGNLSKLADRGELVIVKKKVGRTPAIYKIKSAGGQQ